MSKYINANDLELEVSHYLQCEKESETITLGELKEITNRLPSADVVEVVRCKDCKHSIKKNYDGDISYEYLCVLKSSVTHLEEHEANYFCAVGERKETNE